MGEGSPRCIRMEEMSPPMRMPWETPPRANCAWEGSPLQVTPLAPILLAVLFGCLVGIYGLHGRDFEAPRPEVFVPFPQATQVARSPSVTVSGACFCELPGTLSLFSCWCRGHALFVHAHNVQLLA